LLKLADQLRFVKKTENIILNAHIQKYQKDISGVLVLLSITKMELTMDILQLGVILNG